MSPPREDGRRCLAAREIETLERAGVRVFARNKGGAWSISRSLDAARERFPAAAGHIETIDNRIDNRKEPS